jgi:mannosylfructose-phosphate synthase
VSHRFPARIMMISLHGYVSARAELGLPDTGGQVVYVLKVSEALARLGYDVDIFTRRFEDQPAIERVADGVRIVRIAAGGPDLIRKEWLIDEVPEWVDRAAAWIADAGLSYASIDSHYWDAGWAGDDLSRRLGIPHVHTPHSIGSWKRDEMTGDPEVLDRQYNFRRRIRHERAIYRRADGVIATTPQQARILVDAPYEVDRGKVVVIPPGYDDGRFVPASTTARHAARDGLGVRGPLVLALGRVAANKGYDLLVRAMPTLLDRVPDATLLLAIGSTSPTEGEARQVGELRRLGEGLGIGDHVRFADYVPDDRLADTYRAADLFALSSRYEPFGMTAIEAMACGTPAVVTSTGGLAEMLDLGTEALSADPNDPVAFGSTMASVLADATLARRLAVAGAARVARDFTWDGIATALGRRLQVGDGRPGPASPVVVAQGLAAIAALAASNLA